MPARVRRMCERAKSLPAQIERPHNQRRQADGHGQSERDQAVEKSQAGTLSRRFVSRGVLLLDRPAADRHSYFSDSTGSICAARVAGTVPKITPTSVAAVRAISTDNHEMGKS